MPLKPITERVRRFLGVYHWVIREQLLIRKGRLTLALSLSAVGALAQGGVIGFIAFTVNYLQNPRTFGIAWLDRILDHTLLMLAIFGLILFCIALIGASSTFASSILARSMARASHKQSSVMALSIMIGSSSLDHPGLPDSEGGLRRLIVRNTTHLGKAVETLISLAAPMWRMLVMAGILLSVDLKLSLTIAPLFLLLIPLSYWLSSGVQRDAKRFYEEAVMRMATRVGSIVKMINSQNTLIGPKWVDHFTQLYVADEGVQSYFDEFDRLQLAQERVQFAMSVVTSVFIVFALIVGGYMAASNAMPWGLVVSFLLALLIFVNSIKTTQALVTNLSVFYPAVSQYRQFVLNDHSSQGAGTEIDPGKEKPRDVKRIELACEEVAPGGDRILSLEKGNPVYYVTPQRMNRLNLAEVIEPISKIASVPRDFFIEQTCFVDCRSSPRTGHLRQNLVGMCSDERLEHLVELVVDRLNLKDEIEGLPEGLKTILTPEVWEELSPSLTLGIMIGPLLTDERSIVLLDLALFKQVELETAQAALDLLAGKYILLVTQRLGTPRWLADRVIAVDDRQTIQIGSLKWYEEIEQREITLQSRRNFAENDVDPSEELILE